MTSNQINYQKMLEDRRHNRVIEQETKRANLVSEKLRRRDQRIQSDYHASYFMHNANVLLETGRHNRANESKDLLQLTETLAENRRHNLVTEAQARDKMNLDYSINAQDLGLRAKSLEETKRHNEATERMQSILNEWNYELGSARNELTQQSIDNQMIVDSKRIAETQRSSVQSALLEQQRINESRRHNTTTERLTQTQNDIRGLEMLSRQVNEWYKTLTGKRKSRKSQHY